MGQKVTARRDTKVSRREDRARLLAGIPGENLLKTGAVGSWLGCSREKVVKLINEGSLPYVDLAVKGAPRRELRVPVSAVRKFIAARTMEARNEQVSA